MDKLAFRQFCNDMLDGEDEARKDADLVEQLRAHDLELGALFDTLRTSYLAICTHLRSATETPA